MLKQVFFVVAILGFLGVALAQTVEPPPIRMGLWQTTTTSTISGIQIPPDVAARMQAMGRSLPMGQPQTTVTQSCATPEKWKDMFRHLHRQGNCEFNNEHLTSSSLSADLSCKSPNGRYSSSGHIDVRFVSEEKVHGKAHVVTVMESQPQPIVSDMSFDSAYQGSDCKDVSPDSAKVIR
jgi:Protein of unknown function (DUF3617)